MVKNGSSRLQSLEKLHQTLLVNNLLRIDFINKSLIIYQIILFQSHKIIFNLISLFIYLFKGLFIILLDLFDLLVEFVQDKLVTLDILIKVLTNLYAYLLNKKILWKYKMLFID